MTQMAKPRNYKKEYKRDHSSTKAKKARAKRNAANARLKPGPGKEVEHKRPLSKGGSNSSSNTRVVTRAANRKKGAKSATTRKTTTRRKVTRRRS